MVGRNIKTKSEKTKLILPDAKDFLKVGFIIMISYLLIMTPAVIFNSLIVLTITIFIFLIIFCLGISDWEAKRKKVINKFLVGVLALPLAFLSHSLFVIKKPLNQTIISLVKTENYIEMILPTPIILFVILTLFNSVSPPTEK